jgi:hypothetical protein
MDIIENSYEQRFAAHNLYLYFIRRYSRSPTQRRDRYISALLGQYIQAHIITASWQSMNLDLEQALAPILPGSSDWKRGIHMLYDRDCKSSDDEVS